MVSPTYVLSAYAVKDEATRRKVNFRQTKLRYFIVFLACMVVFSNEYCFDTPSALQFQIEYNYDQKNHHQLSQPQFNLLYSAYSIPNAIVPLLGGMLIDSKGPRLVLILAACLCTLGQGIFTTAGFFNIWGLMLGGRAVFGLGGEILHAAQHTIISRWFKATELSVILGICISFPKMGSSLNSIMSSKVGMQYFENPKYHDKFYNVGVPLAIALCLMILSLGLGLILAYFDKKTQQLQKVKHESQVLSRSKTGAETGTKSMLTSQKLSQVQVQFLQKTTIGLDDKQIASSHGSHLNWKGLKNLPVTYWILLVVVMLAEALFIPFLDNGNKYFMKVYKQIQTTDQAGLYLALPYVVSSIFVIPLGIFAQKIRNRGFLLIGSSTFIYLTYSLMMYIETNSTMRDSTIIPWIPVLLLGICVAIFCSIIVPTVPMICPPELLGTGFGLMEILENVALATFPLISGYIRSTQDSRGKEDSELDQLKGFHWQTRFFYLVACCCVAFTVILEAADRFRGNKLKQKDFKKSYIIQIMKQ